MKLRAGRRQFLQAIAAATVASGTACQDKVDPTLSSSGGASSSGGGAGGTGGSASGTAGQTTAAGNSGSGGSGQPRLTSPLGVALLGLGKYASERLAPALKLTKHCRLAGIVTGTPSKIPTWQSQYGIETKNVYSYDTMGALLDNPDIHVVYIVTPNHLHAQFAIAAARAKKHVWCEKPMAMTPEECRNMIDACTENGVKLCIGYRLQHEPNTQTVRGYAAAAPFGAPKQLDALCGFSGFGPNDKEVWRLKKIPGGGSLFDMGVYCINAARQALGEEPIRVSRARQWTERPDLFAEVDEWTEFELVFPSGAVASCRSSFGETMDSLNITCASGSYELEPFQGYTGVRGAASDGTQFDQIIENQQARQMDDDALAIIEGRDVLVPGQEGERDVRILLAIQQSAKTGQPVELA